ncbi:GNAT family N-acetyltransferase [Paenibacillus doosanensis]|nr:GNAT family N-acetyltransferase [Paenibacillus doosanensis]
MVVWKEMGGIALNQPLGFATESLKLRMFTEDDYDKLFALTRQTEITDLLPDWKMTEEQLQRFLKFVIRSYNTFQASDVRILLAMEEKMSGDLIGWCGVFPNDKLEAKDREIAYAISKDFRNRGYATEAVQGMAAFIWGCTELEEIVAIVKPFNKASRRVLKKSGFERLDQRRLSDGRDYDYFKSERPCVPNCKIL